MENTNENMTQNEADNNIKNNESENGMEKYTIAVIGASGVGKTFFLASYFHSVFSNDTKEIRYRPTLAKGNDKIIEPLVEKIFEEHEKVRGTEKAYNISYSIDSKKMFIDLDDVKGGDTTSPDDYDYNGMKQRLEKADALLIFISAQEVLNKEVDSINRKFKKAIQIVRNYLQDKWMNRADIPIWFIFTKGDKVDEKITENELMNLMPVLLDAAREDKDSSAVGFYERLFKKGKNVNGYKVSAVGVKWDDIENIKVPENANQINIVKAMDDLYDAMYNARHAHNKKLTTIASVGAAILLGGLFLADISYQKGIVSNLEKNVDLSLTSPSFNKDSYNQIKQNILKTRNRYVFPEFLRNSEKIDLLDNKVEERLESFCYDKIKPSLDIDTNKIPTDETAKLSKDVKAYLAYTDFSKINSEHYNKVKNVSWYFDFAVKLKEANDKLSKASEDSDNAYTLLDNWLLDVKELPSEWLNDLSVTTGRLVHLWCEKITVDMTAKEYDTQIQRGKSLLSSTIIPDEIKKIINSNIDKWENYKITIVQNEFNNLKKNISENSEIEESIKQLSEFSRNYPNIPEEINQQLKETRNQCFYTLVSDRISKSDVSIDDLRNLIQKYSEMPEELNEKINSRIRQLINEETKTILRKIDEANDLDALDNSIVDRNEIIKKYPEVKNELDDSIYSKLESINNDEVEKIIQNINRYVSDSAYSNAFERTNNGFKELNNSLSKYRSELNNRVDTIVNSNNKCKTEKLKEIEESEYEYCKNVFNSKKYTGNSKDIESVKSILEDYNKNRCSNNSRNTEINNVVKYLNAIYSGFYGTLTIGSGDYNAIHSLSDTPDIKITVQIPNNGSYSCNKTDDRYPNFNYQIRFHWTIDMGDVNFTVVEEDSVYDDEVFNASVNVKGFFGYNNLNTTIGGKGCSQSISFNASLPSCPWR